MEHTSTTGIGGASKGVIITGVGYGVISKGVIPIRHICVSDEDGADSGNSNDADNTIISSLSLLYWGRTTKRTKEEILQRHVVCVKDKHVPEGSRERKIRHANAMKVISQTFVSANNFVPKNSEGSSESTDYTNIQSEYIGNLAKTKLLEARIITYDTRYLFIVPMLVDEYSGAVKDHWGNRMAKGVYLLSHWSKVSLRLIS